MHNQTISEQSINFYLEELCPRADEIVRMAYFLTLNLDKAQLCLDKVFDFLRDTLNSMQSSERTTWELVRICWETFQQLKIDSGPVDSPLAACLESLELEERAALATVDLMGLTIDDAASVFKWQPHTFRSHLAKARKKLSAIQIEALEENRKRNVSQ